MHTAVGSRNRHDKFADLAFNVCERNGILMRQLEKLKFHLDQEVANRRNTSIKVHGDGLGHPHRRGPLLLQKEIAGSARRCSGGI